MRWFPGRDDPREIHNATQWAHIVRIGVDSNGGSGLCCFGGRLSFVLGDPSPERGLLSFSSHSENDDVTSSSFMRTARMERAAVNGSGDLSRGGKETWNDCFIGLILTRICV